MRPDQVDMRWMGAIVSRNAEVEETGLGAGVLNHPARGIAWLANRLAQYGDGIEAGQIVLAGSFIRPVEARHGDTINAASRLEGFAKEYDAQLAVSADVLRFAGLAKADCETHDISIRGRSGTLETLIVHDMSELDGLLAEAQTGRATAETRKAARPIRGFRAP